MQISDQTIFRCASSSVGEHNEKWKIRNHLHLSGEYGKKQLRDTGATAAGDGDQAQFDLLGGAKLRLGTDRTRTQRLAGGSVGGASSAEQYPGGMSVLIPALDGFISRLSISRLDDLAGKLFNRCNYFYTAVALSLLSFLIGTKQHFGEPIRCLVDQQYSGSWVDYVHDFCFISGRYSLTPPDYESNKLAEFDPTTGRRYENYYQWVPFLLAAQALAFYMPHCMWRWLQQLSSVNMAQVVEEADKVHRMSDDERNVAVKNFIRYFKQVGAGALMHFALDAGLDQNNLALTSLSASQCVLIIQSIL
ncbi:unnamed protein product [Gongylonema pulchrum]|uniref:Innexin n=1 Tax=Gongylonema pulchrum TaxID=637853 RepID=A0A183DSU9_9BILA|nr:unnamed protein product [Gongylonema pulchrum]